MLSGFKPRLKRLLTREEQNVVTGDARPKPELAQHRAKAEPKAPRRAEEIRVFEQGRIRLIYEITHRPGRPMVVVFPGVDTQAARCGTSYYGLQWQLDATVVHIHDNFGAHGNYLLQTAGEPEVRWAVAALLRQLMAETGTKPKDLWLTGTSKGATTALCIALLLKFGNCIAGEPQILLGDFLFPENRDWRQLEDLRSIVYAMTGRVDIEDKPALNNLVPSILRNRLHEYRGKALVIFGKQTGYYDQHIIEIDRALRQLKQKDPKARRQVRVTLREEPFRKHIDVVPVYLDVMYRHFGTLDGTVQSVAAPKAAS